MPYKNIRIPSKTPSYFNLHGVGYIIHDPTKIGPTQVGRVRIKTTHGRRYLTVKVYAKGQKPSLIWQPREKDSNRELALDFPLPAYAGKFWPPHTKCPWFLQVSSSAPGKPNKPVATITEIALVSRVHQQGKWIPQVYRPRKQKWNLE